MPKISTAFIINDNRVQISTLSILLSRQCPTIQIIGTTNDFELGIPELQCLQPDLIFWDIKMENTSTILKLLDKDDLQIILTAPFEMDIIKFCEKNDLKVLLHPIDPVLLAEAIGEMSG